MAFARLSSANREAAPISEINATPLVDVFLVLMLIFLLCAPRAGVQLPLDLPTAGAQGANAATFAPVVIDINAQGQWHWQGRARLFAARPVFAEAFRNNCIHQCLRYRLTSG